MRWSLVGLICLLIGLVVAILDANFVMEPVAWFVLGIGFNTLDNPLPPLRRG